MLTLSFAHEKKKSFDFPADGTPHLEETPDDTPTPDSESSEIDGKVNELGRLEAKVNYVFRGDEELLLRSIFRRVPQPQWQRVAENINSSLGRGDISN